MLSCGVSRADVLRALSAQALQSPTLASSHTWVWASQSRAWGYSASSRSASRNRSCAAPRSHLASAESPDWNAFHAAMEFVPVMPEAAVADDTGPSTSESRSAANTCPIEPMAVALTSPRASRNATPSAASNSVARIRTVSRNSETWPHTSRPAPQLRASASPSVSVGGFPSRCSASFTRSELTSSMSFQYDIAS